MSHRPVGIVMVSVLMVFFGLAEVVTAFRHTFFGLSTAPSTASTVAGAAVGLLYVAAGMLALTLRSWALKVALACLGFDIVGRLAMVAAGYYPVTTQRQLNKTTGLPEPPQSSTSTCTPFSTVTNRHVVKGLAMTRTSGNRPA